MDFAILDFIQTHMRCEFLDRIIPFITNLGESGALWVIIGIALILTKKYRKAGVIMLLCLGAGYLVNDHLIKPLVARPRPFRIHDIALLIPPPNGYSFPSGHTSSSFCAAYCLTRMNRKFTIPAYIAAIAIGFSRMYLYVHFPSDVLAGAIMGTLYGLVFSYILYKIWK